MHTNTKNNIYNIIKKNNGISAHSIITTLNMNASGIFRHLRHLIENNQITKVGKPPKVLYYNSTNNMMTDQNQTPTNLISNWATTGDSTNISDDLVCQTRDVFQARHDRLLNNLKNNLPEDLAFTVAAIAGEIGNNSFDHNLGNWRDAMGIMFSANIEKREIILADRGQGILASIRRVRPETTTDTEALQIAFTQILSGRFPEQRGNGLKFVAKNIKNYNLSLKFYSGDSTCKISNTQMTFEQSVYIIPGTLAIINF